MEIKEFTKQWLQSLDIKNFNLIMKKALNRGYYVKGISNRNKSIPTYVANCVSSSSNIKGKTNLDIIISLIEELSKGDEKDIVKNAYDWLHSEEDKRISIEKMIFEDLDAKTDSGIEKEKDEKQSDEKQPENVGESYEEKIEQLEKTIKSYQEKFKAQKEKVQNLRIINENYEKRIRELEGKLAKESKDKEELIIINEEIEREKNNYKEQVKQKDKDIKTKDEIINSIQEEKKELKARMERAPKILCIGISELEDNGGFNIVFYKEWDLYKKEMDAAEQYYEVWIVGNVEYYKTIDIKNTFNKVLQFGSKRELLRLLRR